MGKNWHVQQKMFYKRGGTYKERSIIQDENGIINKVTF